MTEIIVDTYSFGTVIVADRHGTLVNEDGDIIGEVDMTELMKASKDDWEDIVEDAIRDFQS